MAIRDILVLLHETIESQAHLDIGLGLAKKHGARARGLFLSSEPTMWTSPGHHLPRELAKEFEEQSDRSLKTVVDAAVARAGQMGVNLEVRHQTAAIDSLPVLLGMEGRHADLVVVPQPRAETGGADDLLICEAAFMLSGGPALLVPSQVRDILPPRRVALAWDGSRESSRAIRDAIPLLAGAGEVVLLIVDAHELGDRIGQPVGFAMQDYLGAHEVKVTVHTIGSEGTVRKTLLSTVEQGGFDLLVMGGHGKSRLREAMLGSTTRFMIENTTIPTLFAH